MLQQSLDVLPVPILPQKEEYPAAVRYGEILVLLVERVSLRFMHEKLACSFRSSLTLAPPAPSVQYTLIYERLVAYDHQPINLSQVAVA
jgi:hypothetical protein